MFHNNSGFVMKLTVFSGLTMALSQCRMEVSHLYLVSELKTAWQNLPRRLVCNPLTPTHPKRMPLRCLVFPTSVIRSIISESSPEIFLMKPLSLLRNIQLGVKRSVTSNYHSWLGRVPPGNKDNAFCPS